MAISSPLLLFAGQCFDHLYLKLFPQFVRKFGVPGVSGCSDLPVVLSPDTYNLSIELIAMRRRLHRFSLGLRGA
jgi:hypothetical protein